MERTLVTSALPYANGFIHLGHCAGAYLPADIYVRYLRLKGEEVLYVCGSDEHGVAITIAADKEKTTPQAIIDKYHFANMEAFGKLGLSFDIFSRTSIQEHHETAKEFFGDFLKKGLLTDKEEEQFYDPKAKMFLPDRYVEGVCPNCSYDKARGDQCDSCGAYYNQLELKNPKSLVSGETPVVKSTVHWYLQFNLFQEFLETYIEGHSHDWKDNVLQQTRSWLKQGLAERAITRDLDWGVHIDGIPGIDKDKATGKALYVWFDAVLGYITATKVWAKEQNLDINEWKKWWQNDGTRYLAFIGKDNIVFHTLIFPAMLHARGENYILPDNVPANEFLNLEGQKFSKSRNWSIDLKDFIIDFPESNYIDALRYTLAMSFPETKDADFTWKDFQARNNNELADIVGNFINRTAHFVSKQYDSKVPILSDKYKPILDEWNKIVENKDYVPVFNDSISENDYKLIRSLSDGINLVFDNYNRFRFRDALTETMNIARAANKYFNDEEPWKTSKSDPEKCAKTLFICCNLIYSIAVIFAPILPFTSKKILEALAQESNTGEANTNHKHINFWANASKLNLDQGSQLNKHELLFVKIEDETVQKQILKLGDNLEKSKILVDETNITNLITIDDFKKIKLRTARILEAENVPKSKKLIKLQIDLGNEKRQILAGIAEHYKPEELIGKLVVVVANLQPAKLMGLESQGMLLAANGADGNLTLIHPADDGVGIAAEVR